MSLTPTAHQADASGAGLSSAVDKRARGGCGPGRPCRVRSLERVSQRGVRVEKIKILYADDYDLVLFTARQLLEAEGWEVEVCRDGAATLKKLEGGEHFDLLIFDDRLDGVGCEELIARARESARLRGTPIILFTTGHAHGDPAAREADARLSKPGGLKDLVPTCRRLLPHAASQPGLDTRSRESSGASG